MGKQEVMSYIGRRREMLQKMKEIIISQLNLNLSPEEVDDDSPLFGMGLGLDSIDALDLVVGVEENFGIKVGEEELNVFRSVNSLVDYVMEKSAKAEA